MSTETDILNRLRRLEHKVDFLLTELGLVEQAEASLPRLDPRLADVMALLEQGNKIAAIKVYRQNMGVDLRTAKEAVDKLAW